MAKIGTKQLVMEGYGVITADSGEQAVDIVCNRRERVDLILMDIDLGSGIDGTEAAQEILKEHNIPVLFLSSHTEKEIVEKTEKITSYGYVVKNSGVTVLYASIKMAFKLFEARINEKEKTDALRESEARFDQLAEYSRSIAWEVDTNGLYTYVNHVSEQVIGYRPDELVGVMHFYDICPESEREALIAVAARAFERREKFVGLENQIQAKDGRIVWVSTNGFPVFKADGTVKGYCGSDTDITERKMAEEALSKSEARLKRAELSSKSGNWEFNLDSMVMNASDGAVKLYGVGEKTMKYSSVKQIPLQEYRETLDAALKNLIENDAPYDVEFKIKTADTGEIKDIHSIAVFDREKRTLFGIIQDITARKIVEREIIRAKEQAEAGSRAKNVFLANMSHELRTPMSVIIGFTSLMEMSGLNCEQYEFNNVVKKSSAKLLEIINALLDLSLLDACKIRLQSKPFDVRAAANDSVAVITGLVKNKELKLKSDIDAGIDFMVSGDKSRFKQILLNLLSNAVKFTASGTVLIKLRIVSKEAGGIVRIAASVFDEGIGIATDKFDEIFEKFHQLDESMTKSYKGPGLGLSIAKGLVELMGGTIGVQSEVGKGSCFTVEIPFEICASAVDESLRVAESPMKRPVEILICEDDEISCSLLMAMAPKFNWNIKIAKNGKEAFDIYLKQKFDAIIMDGQMPEMNGLEATLKIREVEKFSSGHVPIVALTAYAGPLDRAKFIDAGMDDYIPKPLTNINVLYETVMKYLK